MNQLPSGHRAKNVVLLGIGHTNAHVVKEWADHPLAGCQLICVSNFATVTYSGMLPGTLGGQFAEDEMRIDLRALADRAGAQLIIAHTSGIDLQAGELQFSDRPPLPFDVLSIGVGSMPAGWRRHAQSPLLVPIKPMQTFLSRLRDHLQEQSESPAKGLRRIAIVGGGVAGIEIAFCLQQNLQQSGSKAGGTASDEVMAIEIFTSSARIADGMTERSIGRLERLLAKRGIVVQAGKRVIDVSERELTTADGQRYPACCVIWATGASPPTILEALNLQSDGRGFVATSSTLQSLTDPRIFAVGDSGTVVSSPAPKAGVYAVRQSPILWHNLQAVLRGGVMREFEPQCDFLKILNTGDGKALLQYGWLTAHARWCLWLKTMIDRQFMKKFQAEGGKGQ